MPEWNWRQPRVELHQVVEFGDLYTWSRGEGFDGLGRCSPAGDGHPHPAIEEWGPSRTESILNRHMRGEPDEYVAL